MCVGAVVVVVVVVAVVVVVVVGVVVPSRLEIILSANILVPSADPVS